MHSIMLKSYWDTRVTVSSTLPTQVKFYLYNKEYIYDDDGKLVDPGESDKLGKRSLYIKVTTMPEGMRNIANFPYIQTGPAPGSICRVFWRRKRH